MKTSSYNAFPTKEKIEQEKLQDVLPIYKTHYRQFKNFLTNLSKDKGVDLYDEAKNFKALGQENQAALWYMLAALNGNLAAVYYLAEFYSEIKDFDEAKKLYGLAASYDDYKQQAEKKLEQINRLEAPKLNSVEQPQNSVQELKDVLQVYKKYYRPFKNLSTSKGSDLYDEAKDFEDFGQDNQAALGYTLAALSGNLNAVKYLAYFYSKVGDSDEANELYKLAAIYKKSEEEKLRIEDRKKEELKNNTIKSSPRVGVEIDLKKTFDQLGADQKNPEAILNLAKCYFYGKGVEENPEKAVLLCEAAEKLSRTEEEKKTELKERGLHKFFPRRMANMLGNMLYVGKPQIEKLVNAYTKNPYFAAAFLDDNPNLLEEALYTMDDRDSLSGVSKMLAKRKDSQDFFLKSFRTDKNQFMRFFKNRIEMAVTMLENSPAIANLLTIQEVKLMPFENLVYTLGLTNRIMQHARLKELESLDLAGAPLITSKLKQSCFEDPMIDCKKNAELYVSRTFPSFESFFNDMMYGRFGFYSRGTLLFRSDDEKKKQGAFATCATGKEKTAFAASYAFHLFHKWKLLINQQKLEPNHLFNVLECGAGDGKLCINILKVIQNMANQDPEWDTFYKSLHYQIVDRAPALLARQKSNIQSAGLGCKNISLFLGNALQLQKVKGLSKPIHALISNELVDMFASYIFRRNEQGHLDVQMMIPVIKKKIYEKFFATKLEISTDELVKRSDYHKSVLKNLNCNLPADRMILSKKDYLEIHASYIEQKLSKETIFEFEDLYISHQYFKDAEQFVKHNPHYFDTLMPKKTRNAILGINDFVKSAQQTLDDNGMLLTVDYGDTNDDPGDIRTYHNGVRGTDFKQLPAEQDITSNVPFKLMDHFGKNHGMKTEFYGSQEQFLTPEAKDFFIKYNVLTPEEASEFIHTSSIGNLKVCVQTKNRSESPLVTSFTGEKERISYAQLFAKKKELLTKFSAQATLKKLKDSGWPCEWNSEKNEFVFYTTDDNTAKLWEKIFNENRICFRNTFKPGKIIAYHIKESEKDKIPDLASITFPSTSLLANSR